MTVLAKLNLAQLLIPGKSMTRLRPSFLVSRFPAAIEESRVTLRQCVYLARP